MQTTLKIRPYKAPRWASNSHVQTIAPRLFWRRKLAELSWQQFELNDGDFVDLTWQHKFANDEASPILLLLHGLHGCVDSPYIKSLMIANERLGWRIVVMHQRGCSGRDNRFWRSYHSGETNDLSQVVTMISERYPNADLFATGYSMGGNILLNYLLQNANTPIKAAISISAPLQLDACANAIDQGFSKVYQRYLIGLMRRSLISKQQSHPNQDSLQGLHNWSTFWDFDDQYTAPVHGFKGAEDYYQQCSPKSRVDSIRTPHLIVHAKDDPFMDEQVELKDDQLSEHGQYLLCDKGGHVGFLEGSISQPQCWLNHVIEQFFSSKLTP